MPLGRIGVAIALGLRLAAGAAHAGPHRYPPANAILIDPLRSPYRVHVATMGDVSVAIDGDAADGGGHQLERTLELPVVEEQGDRVRVLVEHDEARMMLWTHAGDLAWSIARPVRLRGRGDVGVWLTTGAPVDVSGSGRRRTVRHDDDQVQVSGTVPADAIAHVFAVSRGLQPTGRQLAEEIRDAPGGALLHAGALPVEVLARHGGWAQVEYRSRYLRIRGWVAAGQLDDEGFLTAGTGNGSSFGLSDTDRVEVPAGACLYERAGGPPAGFQLATALRYVVAHDGDWWQLYVGTPWGLVTVFAHATGADQPLWDRCAPSTIAPFAADP